MKNVFVVSSRKTLTDSHTIRQSKQLQKYLCLISVSYGMRAMIGISETHKGSAYGSKDRNDNSKAHKE